MESTGFERDSLECECELSERVERVETESVDRVEGAGHWRRQLEWIERAATGRTECVGACGDWLELIEESWRGSCDASGSLLSLEECGHW